MHGPPTQRALWRSANPSSFGRYLTIIPVVTKQGSRSQALELNLNHRSTTAACSDATSVIDFPILLSSPTLKSNCQRHDAAHKVTTNAPTSDGTNDKARIALTLFCRQDHALQRRRLEAEHHRLRDAQVPRRHRQPTLRPLVEEVRSSAPLSFEFRTGYATIFYSPDLRTPHPLPPQISRT